MDRTTRRTTLLKTPSPPKSFLSNLTLNVGSTQGQSGSGDRAAKSGQLGSTLQKRRCPLSNTLQTAAFMPSTKRSQSTSKSVATEAEPKTEDPQEAEHLPSQTPECNRVLKRLEQSGLLNKIRASRASAGVDRERNRVKSGSQVLNKTLLLPPHQQVDSDEDPEDEEWRQKQIDMLVASGASPSSTEDSSEPSGSTKPLSPCEELSEERDSGCSTPNESQRRAPKASVVQSDIKTRAGTPNPKSAASVQKSVPKQHPQAHEKSSTKSSASTSKQPLTGSKSSGSASGKLNLEVIPCNGRTYHVLRELGKGGSSVVNEVFDPHFKRCFAMKIVDLTQANEGERRAFKNEINLLRKLNECERVVRIHDFEYKKQVDQLVLVMEKGDADLSNVLKSFVDTENNQLDQDVVKFYWKEMLRAVREIHAHGIVHADLKPVNFITVAGKLKLIDFGIANALAPEATSIIKDHQVGTINYMSPEALTNRSTAQDQTIVKYNTKSDIWSLGCILYNLVYGYPPFGHYKDLLGKFKAITDPNHKIKFSERAPPVVIDCLKQCLRYDPAKRPTADQLLKHPFLTGGGQDLNSTVVPNHHKSNAAQDSLMSQISGFTPNRMRQLSRVVEQLSKAKK